MSNRYEQALQQYELALRDRDYPSLKKVIAKLAACTSYRTDKIKEFLGDKADDISSMSCELTEKKTGTILVIPAVGLAPYKIPKRIPIGAAVVLAGAFLTPMQLSQANDFAVKGMLKWINFATLTQTKPKYRAISVKSDGKAVAAEYGENISALVKRSFDRAKGKLIAAAIVRMIARAVAGAAVNKAASSAGSDNGLGLLAQIIVEGAMTAADTPDTRSWVTLPASMFLSRIEVPAGTHKISVLFSGPEGKKTITSTVTVAKSGFVVLPVATMQ
jgi:hypothetical protein